MSDANMSAKRAGKRPEPIVTNFKPSEETPVDGDHYVVSPTPDCPELEHDDENDPDDDDDGSITPRPFDYVTRQPWNNSATAQAGPSQVASSMANLSLGSSGKKLGFGKEPSASALPIFKMRAEVEPFTPAVGRQIIAVQERALSEHKKSHPGPVVAHSPTVVPDHPPINMRDYALTGQRQAPPYGPCDPVASSRYSEIIPDKKNEFSFDVEQKGISRFVTVIGIPQDWVAAGGGSRILDQFQLDMQVTAHMLVGVVEGSPRLFLYFDDLRNAERAVATFNIILGANRSAFVNANIFYSVMYNHPKARSVNEYEGQITIVATFCGPVQNSDLDAMYRKVRDWLLTIGDVRAFSCVRIVNPVKAAFRAEFHRLCDASQAMKTAGVDHRLDDEYSVVVADFAPPGYARWCHKSAAPQAPVRAARPYELSMTNRTAWSGPSVLTPSELARLQAGAAAGPVAGPSSGSSLPAAPSGPFDSRRTRGAGRGLRRSAQYEQTLDYHRGPSRGYGGNGPVGRSTSMTGFGDQRRTCQSQAVCVIRIEDGRDVRTTLMVRNIPNRMGWMDLKKIIDYTSFGKYDFSYLRTDFGNACNVGYAFVNFTRPEYIIDFFRARVGNLWPDCNSDKICEVSYATIQGQDCLIQKFRNSSVMQEYSGYTPKLWYSYDSDDVPADKAVGDEQPMPRPDNLSKLARSLDNAQAVGLYPPRGAQMDREDRRHRSQYDRGTPRALREERLHSLNPTATRFIPSAFNITSPPMIAPSMIPSITGSSYSATTQEAQQALPPIPEYGSPNQEGNAYSYAAGSPAYSSPSFHRGGNQ